MMLSVHLSESGDNARDWLVWAAPPPASKVFIHPYMQWPPLTEFIHRPGSITSLYTFPLEYTNLTTHKNTEYTLYKVYKPDADILAINTKPALQGILTAHTSTR